MAQPVEVQQKYLSEVEATFSFLEENFDSLYERCQSGADRQLLRSLHAAGRDAYWRGVASALRDGNQIVHEIYTDLSSANQQLRDMLANLQNVGALLSLARQAVRLAGSLVTLAAA